MGLHNQSPATGHFKPAVHLGDRVKAGDLLGTVCDALGREVHRMRSERIGYVLTLRT